MELRVVVRPVRCQLWRVVDSAHPQIRIDYSRREDAIDCARGLATENAPALIEVLSPSGSVVLRERYEQSADGVLVDPIWPVTHEEFARESSRRSTG